MADFTLEDAMQVRATHISGTCPCAAALPSLHSFPTDAQLVCARASKLQGHNIHKQAKVFAVLPN